MMRTAIRSGNVTLSAQVDGDEEKPWLVLSNSLASTLHMWDDQISLLIRTHRVIRYDTRGHGQSDAPPGPYSFTMLVDDMRAVIDHFGVQQADVMGLSLGGMTALGLGLGHPSRAKRLVVCDARADAPQPFVQSWIDRITAVEKGGMQAVVDGTLARWFTPSCPAGPVERARRMILSTPVQGYIGCAQALKGLDYLKHLASMRPPVRYIVGGDDLGAPKDAMAAMAAQTPGSEFKILPGLAHIPNMENPSAFADAITDWLEAA